MVTAGTVLVIVSDDSGKSAKVEEEVAVIVIPVTVGTVVPAALALKVSW